MNINEMDGTRDAWIANHKRQSFGFILGRSIDRRKVEKAYLEAQRIIQTEPEETGCRDANILMDSLNQDEQTALYDLLRECGTFRGRMTVLGAFKRWLKYESWISEQLGE